MTLIEVACSLAILAVAGTYLTKLVAAQHEIRRNAEFALATELKLENVADKLRHVDYDQLEAEVVRLNSIYGADSVELRIERFDTDVGKGLHVTVSTTSDSVNPAAVTAHRWRLSDDTSTAN